MTMSGNWTGRPRRPVKGKTGGKFHRTTSAKACAASTICYRCVNCGNMFPEKKPVQCSCGSISFQFFHSTGEAKRYGQLLLKEAAGLIKDLVCQPKFDLFAYNFEVKQPAKIGQFIADFSYTIVATDEAVVEDFKGTITDLANWKVRHLAQQSGITVKLIGE